MRKILIIILVLLSLSVLAAMIYIWLNKKQLSDIEKAKENALPNVLKINNQSNALIINQPGYQILYLKEFGQFLISILKSPFEEMRQKAEQKFLEITQANENTACQLNTIITTPFFANPDLAGQTFYLSFCQKSK